MRDKLLQPSGLLNPLNIELFVKFEVLNREVFLADRSVVDRIKVANMDQSIFNVPSSICKLLNIPEMGSPSLRKEILDPLGDDIENVIFILADAVAFHRIENWMNDDKHILMTKDLGPLITTVYNAGVILVRNSDKGIKFIKKGTYGH